LKPFAQSTFGKLVGRLAQVPRRPSELVNFSGSELEKLLFDISVLSSAAAEEKTLKDEIKAKYARMKAKMSRKFARR